MASMGNRPIVVQRSAGGVVLRGTPPNQQVLVIITHSQTGESRWQLPKGWINPGEAPEATAVREVREETGIQAEVIAPLETIEYWFYDRDGGSRIHKFVSFYLMRYL